MRAAKKTRRRNQAGPCRIAGKAITAQAKARGEHPALIALRHVLVALNQKRTTGGERERIVRSVAYGLMSAMMGGTERRLLFDLERIVAERRAELAPPVVEAAPSNVIDMFDWLKASLKAGRS